MLEAAHKFKSFEVSPGRYRLYRHYLVIDSVHMVYSRDGEILVDIPVDDAACEHELDKIIESKTNFIYAHAMFRAMCGSPVDGANFSCYRYMNKWITITDIIQISSGANTCTYKLTDDIGYIMSTL